MKIERSCGDKNFVIRLKPVRGSGVAPPGEGGVWSIDAQRVWKGVGPEVDWCGLCRNYECEEA